MKKFLLTLVLVAATSCAHAADPALVKRVKMKADQSLTLLNEAAAAGQDISAIVPKMQDVKKRGDGGDLAGAEQLLDEVLADFSRLQSRAPATAAEMTLFKDDRRINIHGYDGSPMEVFITRDGQYLFFNCENTGGTQQDMFYARRIDDYNFQFLGEVKGVNTDAVEGVPSLDTMGNIYYTCTKNYKIGRYASTCAGRYGDGAVTNVRTIDTLALNKPGWLNMDTEVSADGQTLYSTQTRFESGSLPQESYFFYAVKRGDTFVPAPDSAEIFKNINKDKVVYGISISTDEREMVYTSYGHGGFTSHYANRPSKTAPFNPPQRIGAITGFSEAPAFTNDGRKIYYHKKSPADGKFHIHVLHR